MKRRTWFALALLCMLIGLYEAPARTHAASEKEGATLRYESAYSEQPLLRHAKTIGLEVTLDGKGGGRGTLILDPNTRRGKVSTLIAQEMVKVTLKQVEDEKHAKEGRQVYELQGKGLDRVRVAVPVKENEPSMLLIGGNDGKINVIEMRRKQGLSVEPFPAPERRGK